MKLKLTEQMIFVAAGSVAAGIITKQLAKKFPNVITQPVAGALLALPAILFYNEKDMGRLKDLNLLLLGLMAGGIASGIDGVGELPLGINGSINRPIQINVK